MQFVSCTLHAFYPNTLFNSWVNISMDGTSTWIAAQQWADTLKCKYCCALLCQSSIYPYFPQKIPNLSVHTQPNHRRRVPKDEWTKKKTCSTSNDLSLGAHVIRAMSLSKCGNKLLAPRSNNNTLLVTGEFVCEFAGAFAYTLFCNINVCRWAEEGVRKRYACINVFCMAFVRWRFDREKG